MQENREQAIAWIGLSEGGYSNNPKDPGGETNFGITARTYAAWNTKTGRPQRSVKNITKAEANEIIVAQYLDPIRFDDLPTGIDYLVADYAVNSGPARAMREIQTIVGVAADGVNGLQTLAAIRAADQVQLANAYCDARLKFLRSLKTWKTFGKGWTARVEFARAQALTLIGRAAPAAPVAEASSKGLEADISSAPMVAKITAQAGAGAAALGTLSAALKELPETATVILISAAAAAGLLALSAWLYRRVRA